MPKYREIAAEISRISGIKWVHHCWIAHVLSDHGLTTRQAANRKRSGRAEPCPASKRPMVEQALKNLGVLPVTGAQR